MLSYALRQPASCTLDFFYKDTRSDTTNVKVIRNASSSQDCEVWKGKRSGHFQGCQILSVGSPLPKGGSPSFELSPQAQRLRYSVTQCGLFVEYKALDQGPALLLPLLPPLSIPYMGQVTPQPPTLLSPSLTLHCVVAGSLPLRWCPRMF